MLSPEVRSNFVGPFHHDRRSEVEVFEILTPNQIQHSTMSDSSKKPSLRNRKPADVVYSILGAVVPGCGTALRLVALGQERPLTLRERLVLKYNSPLCLHCNCKRETFDEELKRMREIEEQRKGGDPDA